MKKLTYTTAIFMAMAATSVFAHHPSADMNPNFDMVTDQLEAVDSPHLDMDVSDMGSTTATGDSTMAEFNRSQAGWNANQTQAGGAFDDVSSTDAADAAGTIDLLENVAQ